MGESEIAEITEEIFKNSGFLLGYKASKPYVTVKVWVPKELLQTKDDYFKVFESKIKHWLSVPNS